MAEEILKRCCCCKQEKSVSQFGADRSAKDLLKKQCKVCHNAGNAKYRKNNPETSRASCLNWQKENPEKARAKQRRFLEKNPGYNAARMREYTQRNPETVKENRRKSKEKNRVHFAVSNRMRRWLKNKPSWSRTFEMIGYTALELKVHLERQFVAGMNWENYGSAWHIDHITPLNDFKVLSIDDPELKIAWALPNLRPLWAKENLSKNARRLYLI